MVTYAAVNSLAIIGAYDQIHRADIYRFFLSMKQPNGSFSVHTHGYRFAFALSQGGRLA